MRDSIKMRLIMWGLILVFVSIAIWVFPYCLDITLGEIYLLPTTLLATVLVFMRWAYIIIVNIREEDKE